MSQTILLYIFILIGCIITTSFTPRSIYGKYSQQIGIKYYLYVLIPIVLYTLFWGLRYDVGADYFGYIDYFNEMPEDIEIGYKALNYFLKELGFSYVSIFIVTSFFPICTLFILSRYESKLFAILLLFFYFSTSFVFFTQNGIRQTLAFCILLILISKTNNSNYLYLLIFAIIAISFHYSAIVPLIYILFLYLFRVIKINKYILATLLIVLAFFGNNLYEIFFSKFSFIFELLNYTGYQENITSYEKSLEFGSGLGMILKLLLNLIVILHQDKIINSVHKTPAYYFYMLFLLGVFLEPIIAENSIMKRMNIYFISNRFIIYAYLCTYFFNTKNQKTISRLIGIFYIISLSFLYIAAILSNSNLCVPYKTIFNII